MAIKTYMVTGTSLYAKVLGAAPPGYENGPAEWTFDLVIDEEGKKQYLKSGADPFYVKVNKESGAEYIRFVRKAIKADNSEGKPIRVVGPDGNDWDQGKLIGNGSILNVKFSINEVKSKGTKRLKPSVLAIQVWEHKEYKGKSDFPTKPVEAAADNW